MYDYIDRLNRHVQGLNILPPEQDFSAGPRIMKEVLADNYRVTNSRAQYRQSPGNISQNDSQNITGNMRRLFYGEKKILIGPIIDKIIDEVESAIKSNLEIYLPSPLTPNGFKTVHCEEGAKRLYLTANKKNKIRFDKLNKRDKFAKHMDDELYQLCLISSFFDPKEMSQNPDLVNRVLFTLRQLSKTSSLSNKFGNRKKSYEHATVKLIDKLVTSKPDNGIKMFSDFLEIKVLELTKRQIASKFKPHFDHEKIKMAFTATELVEDRMNAIVSRQVTSSLKYLHLFMMDSITLLNSFKN